MQPSAFGSYADHNDLANHTPHQFEPKKTNTENDNTREQIDYLIGQGFMWEEAVTLLHLREHLYENAEMRQRINDDHYMNFARWLFLNGELNDN